MPAGRCDPGNKQEIISSDCSSKRALSRLSQGFDSFGASCFLFGNWFSLPCYFATLKYNIQGGLRQLRLHGCILCIIVFENDVCYTHKGILAILNIELQSGPDSAMGSRVLQ